MNMQHMVVIYESGTPGRIDIRKNIPKGGHSRMTDLHGVGQSSIRRIELWCDMKCPR
jgi:hypothetical protein